MAGISPLAPETIVEAGPIEGVRIATAAAGIKYRDRTDLMLMVFDRPTAVAGVFTRSRCASAPVEHCRMLLSGGVARGLVVNSGNANAFTGLAGREATAKTSAAAAEAIGCRAEEVFLASTGVIGEPMRAEAFAGCLVGMAGEAKADGWRSAAEAIMTTDTYPKVATRTVALGDATVTLTGIAKGAGMIAPDMATMLSFIATDAPIAAPVLQTLLSEATEPSFNSVTIDSDTSTSDTVLAFATGAAEDRGAPSVTSADDPVLGAFRAAFADLAMDLARQIVRDGEGARKEIAVTVNGARDDRAAKRIALSIANSPLVKTAVAGEDANWGRVVMAVGKAGEEADRDRLAIWFADLRVAVDGERDPAYSEAAAAAVMRGATIPIRVDLSLGEGSWTVYGCDLTKDYVEINGDYRS